MSSNSNKKCRLCRRAKEKLFLKGDRCGTPKCAMVRRAYPPGVHGAKGKKALSEFGQQLLMKQKIKRIYNVLERQFKKYFKEVQNKPGVTGDLLLQKLEMRLDNAVYRAGLAASRRQARQIVMHSHFFVNGKRVNIPSYEVKAGDLVEVKQNKINKGYFLKTAEILKGKKGMKLPSWFEVNTEKMSILIKSKPAKEDLNIDVDAQMVVEYYSR
ncbi:MAG: 30S ribosomal protein S4 [Candidatus Moranbacteria bacterium]|nr:30S ribosomal protein S4 [Candidatus Moranbacteria bacterium]